MKLLVVFAVLTIGAQSSNLNKTFKRSYVCPPDFIRLGHKCYFFSKEPAVWRDAYFSCRAKHSNLAVIRNSNQDKLVRSVLLKDSRHSKTSESLERWLGATFDWEQMSWKWAASGKPLAYSGFLNSHKEEDKDSLQWQCVVMDPSLQYKWSHRSCLEKKYFICQTKLKVVGSKGRKKLQHQYKADKYNKLNEIPVPDIPEYRLNNGSTPTELKANIPFNYRLEINNSLNDQADQALYAHVLKRKPRRNQNKRKNKKNRRDKNRSRTNKSRPKIQNIKWKTYKEDTNLSDPLYPKPIVEEFSYSNQR